MIRHKGIYPKDWRDIALRIKHKAHWKCQKCGRAHNPKENVILTVHHKDGDTTNSNDSNLIALCRRCHLQEELKLQHYLDLQAQKRAGQTAVFPTTKICPP